MNAAVLAGGRGSRMDFRDKSALTLEGETFLEIIVSKLSRFRKIMVISNGSAGDYPSIKAEFHSDLVRDTGPLGGIYTALTHSDRQHVFVTTCDMPLIEKKYIDRICSFDDCDLVVPVYGGKYEMLFALYSRACLPRIKEMIESGRYKLTGIFDDESLKIKTVPVDSRFISSLKNINTEEDYSALTGDKL